MFAIIEIDKQLHCHDHKFWKGCLFSIITPASIEAIWEWSRLCHFFIVNCHGYVHILKLCLHIAVTIAEHVSDDAPKRVLRLSTHRDRLQIFLMKHEYLRSSQLCEDQGTREKLKKNVFVTMCLRSLRLMVTRLEA